MSTKDLGNLGERIACEYLVKKGFKILCRNYEIRWGEIDIIARKKCGLLELLRGKKDKTIHFIEVKALSKASGLFSPEQRANWKKQRKLIRLSQIWLEKNKIPLDFPWQIDIMGIFIDKSNKRARISYFENAVKDR